MRRVVLLAIILVSANVFAQKSSTNLFKSFFESEFSKKRKQSNLNLLYKNLNTKLTDSIKEAIVIWEYSYDSPNKYESLTVITGDTIVSSIVKKKKMESVEFSGYSLKSGYKLRLSKILQNSEFKYSEFCKLLQKSVGEDYTFFVFYHFLETSNTCQWNRITVEHFEPILFSSFLEQL